MFPTIGIVILNYNSAELSLRLLANLQQQRNVSLHIVIVDNCSKEEDREKLMPCAAKNVTLLFQDNNRGYAAGNNVGLRYLASLNVEYMAVANPDIIFDNPEFLSSLIKEYQKQKDIGFITGQQEIPAHPENSISGCSMPSYMDLLRNCFYLGRIKKTQKQPCCGTRQYDILSGCFFLGAREVWEKIDFLDEGTFLFGEESIIAYKTKMYGLSNYVCHNLTFTHLHSFVIRKSVNIYRQYMYFRESKMFFLKKYMKATTFQQAIFAVCSWYAAIEIFLLNSAENICMKVTSGKR